MTPISAGITLAGFAGAYCAFGVSEDFCRGEGANRRCDCNGYRPVTLGVDSAFASLSASFLYGPARTEALFDHLITQIGL